MGALTSRAPFPLTVFALRMQTTAQEGMAARMLLVPSGASGATVEALALRRSGSQPGLEHRPPTVSKPFRAFRSAEGSNPSPYG